MTQILVLSDKDFKASIVTMLKYIQTNKQKKKLQKREKTGNIKKIQTIKKNQIEIL